MNRLHLPSRLLRTRRAPAIAAAIALLLGTPSPAPAAWERAHADAANRGFVDVVTRPAGRGSLSVPGLGTFAPGAGPVIAPDGTVYLGTLEGKVIALHADGRPFWSRDITPGQSIMASPAIGADGSVYVVGTLVRTVRDHRDGKTVIKTVFDTTLHKFTASGGWVAQIPFPRHGNGAATTAPPNVLPASQFSGETVIVPARYIDHPFRDVRVIAFSPDGAILADQLVVRSAGGSATGGADASVLNVPICLYHPAPGFGQFFCLTCGPQIGCDFRPLPVESRLPPPPMPGVAIFNFAGGGAPFVLVSDQLHDVVGYTFNAGVGFTERFRLRDVARRFASPPMVLPDGHTLIGTAGGEVVFTGPNLNPLPPVRQLGSVFAAPTRLADGRVIVVQNSFNVAEVAVLQDAELVSNDPFPGTSMASAAASRTHVFVSTADAFHTLDAATLAVVSRFDWVGGGLSPPAIGPQGRVYAIASNILFVFPPPKTAPRPHQGTTAGIAGGQPQVVGTAGVAPTPQPAQPQPQGAVFQPVSQTFQPPLTRSGNRLHACLDRSDRVCGKPVAASFCQQRGFARAGKIDIERRRVQAETLTGQICTKKRCRVFDLIVCSN